MLHVGVNLPEGETDLRRPAEDAVADAMKRAFVIELRPGADVRSGRSADCRASRSGEWFAWAIVVLLLLGACDYEQVEEMNERIENGDGR